MPTDRGGALWITTAESLKILDFYEMHREFVLRMLPDGGQDYWKVKKVTTICLRYRINGEKYQYTSLMTQTCWSVYKGECWRIRLPCGSANDKV